jgi:hypothetical protein
VNKADQTITFPVQISLGTNSTRTLDATTTSNLTITYTSSNTGVATISGGNVTGVAGGTTTLTASQAGDANWNAATSQTQSLTVASLVTWNFTTASPANVPVGATISDIVQGNNNGVTVTLNATSASSTANYTIASGGNNAGAAARTGALSTTANGSAYFEFSANATSGNSITFSGISLGTRSTSTAPTTISLRSDADSYASDIAVVTYTANSAWVLLSNSTFSQVYEGNRTYRLYGYNGAGSPSANIANWRIDDLTLTLAVSPSSTPTAPAITSATTASATVGTAFSYTITASNNATS